MQEGGMVPLLWQGLGDDYAGSYSGAGRSELKGICSGGSRRLAKVRGFKTAL